MNGSTRRAVAYIAGRLIREIPVSTVYDYDKGQYFSLAGDVSKRQVSVFDYDGGFHVGGSSGDGRSFSLYDYGHSSYISLEIHGNQFRGYDYASGAHFSGRVDTKAVSLYDYGKSKYFNYSV